ncbi:MAG: hypothetical protein IT563_11935 [Alphaproteobacteria bacterium]|nr:hypothetical protein [Alphaproteobacteria bacterium]
MIPILVSIVGALAGKAVVSAVEWMAEDKPAQGGSVVKSDVRGQGLSNEATKVTISPAAQQKSIATRYDPGRLSPQRLGNLADELKTNGTISAADHALLMRVAQDARQSDAANKVGNSYLNPRNMVAELDRMADQRLKAGDKAEAAQYQKLSVLLKDIKAKGGTATSTV